MTWYAAHIISFARFLDGIQDEYHLLENIVLIEAVSVQEARTKAQNIGVEEYHGNALTLNDKEAVWEYAGVRKLIECENIPSISPGRYDTQFRPGHGTEITYSWLSVKDAQALAALVGGDSVEVVYDE